MKYLISHQYKYLVHYLIFLNYPLNFDKVKYKALRLEAQKFFTSNGQLYQKVPMGILLLCLVEEEIPKVIEELHSSVCGAHYNQSATTHNILKFSFYWPKLLSEVHTYVRACEKCHIFPEKQRLAPLHLILVFVEEPFRQWELDFIREITHHSMVNTNGYLQPLIISQSGWRLYHP